MPGSGPGEVTGGPQAAREIIACAERTLAAASARIEVHVERKTPPGWQPPGAGRLGIGLRVLRGLGPLRSQVSWRVIHGRWPEYPVAGEGFIEPARGRYMIDYGSFALLLADGKLGVGRPGRPLRSAATLPAEIWPVQVLWLLRLLPAATDARLEGSGTLHGTVCQKLAAHLDMARALATTVGGVRTPAGERHGDLKGLPVTVWIDGQHVRRIEFQHSLSPSLRQHAQPSESQQPRSPTLRQCVRRTGFRQPLSPLLLTLDLWEFGVPVDGLDWSRLPAFRSPGRADP